MLYKAISETANGIKEELRTCHEIARKRPFDSFLDRQLPHQWSLEPALDLEDIKPKKNTFEVIDASFRPNTKRLLKLLSSEDTYGNKLVAIRELVQNAFDAVREDIACQYIRRSNPKELSLLDTLADAHQVSIKLEALGDPARLWLTCVDSGIGLSKNILERHLLVSGNERTDIPALKRKCRKEGFEFERSGKFGIGALSYFMLADRVEILTRRSQYALTGGNEPNGWNFFSEGVGSFGELRKDMTITQGSEFRLRLSLSVTEAQEFYGQLAAYLRGLLIRTPCKVILENTLGFSDRKQTDWGKGWQTDKNTIFERLFRNYESNEKKPERFYSKADQAAISEYKQEEIDFADEVKKELRWEIFEQALPNEIGYFRIHVPVFNLNENTSLIFLNKYDRGFRRQYANGAAVLAQNGLAVTFDRDIRERSFGLSGISRVGGYIFIELTRYPIYLEVDWTKESEVAVTMDRNRPKLTDDGKEALRILKDNFVRELLDFLKKNEGFQNFGNRLILGLAHEKDEFHWIFTTQKKQEFGKIETPVVCDSEKFRNKKLVWKGRLISKIPSFAAGKSWNGYMSASHILVLNSKKFTLIPAWDKLKASMRLEDWTALFPPKWLDLVSYFCRTHDWDLDGLYANSSNPVGAHRDADSQKFIDQNFDSISEIKNADQLLREIAENKDLSLCWLERFIGGFIGYRVTYSFNYWMFWTGLLDRNPDFLKNVWSHIHGTKDQWRPLYSLYQSKDGLRLSRFFPTERIQVIRQPAWIAKKLGDPGEDWKIKIVR